MNRILVGFIGVIFASFTSNASAAFIDLGILNIDVNQGSERNVVDVHGEPGIYWDSDIIHFEAMEINEGDTIRLGFEFLPGQSLELLAGDYAAGREIVQYRQSTPTMQIRTSTIVSFTGVEGDLLPGEFSSTGTASFFHGTIGRNMTDLAFSFHDIHFETEILSLTEGTAELSNLQLRIGGSAINRHTSIPEPIGISLLALGLAGLGFIFNRS